MNISIMRHSLASFTARCDNERVLSEQGVQLARMKGQMLINQAVKFDAVLVSPYQRALQTLQVLQEFAIFTEKVQIKIFAGITPSGSVINTEQEIAFFKASGYKHLLIISHLPFVSLLTEQLSGHFHSFNCADICMLSLKNDRFVFQELW